jgi:hypothetical protein
MAMLRAADLTLEHGCTHFAVLSEGDDSTTAYLPATTTTNGYVNSSGGFSATSNTYGGAPIHKPGSRLFVMLLKEAPSADDPSVFDARFIHDTLSPKYK